MSGSNEIRQLLRKAAKQGFEYELKPNGHFAVTAPNGTVIQLPSSPGTAHSVANAVNRLKRLGYEPNTVPAKLRQRQSQPQPQPQPAFTAADKNALVRADFTVTSGVERVTPELALEWLVDASENRRLRKGIVTRYARDMQEGRWYLTGEPVIFDRDGVLRDGQHRLNAVLEADVTVDLFVVRGVEPEAQRAMDRGIRRTAGDQIRFSGASGYYMHIAASTRLHVEVVQGYSRQTISDQQLLDLYEADSEGWEKAGAWASRIRAAVGGSAGGYGLAYYLTAAVDRDAAHEFWSNLVELRFTGDEDPIKALHRALSRRSTSVGHELQLDALNYCLRAWQRWRRGEDTHMIMLRRDSAIPRPEELK